MEANSNLLRGKVAKVLSRRQVALNIGRSDGVQEGMLFDIFVPGSDEIRDPDTGTVLGTVDRRKVKAHVKVTSLQDKFCVASTYRQERVNVGGLGPIDIVPRLRSFGEPPKWETRIELFKSSEARQEPLTDDEANVSAGDPVVQVTELAGEDPT